MQSLCTKTTMLREDEWLLSEMKAICELNTEMLLKINSRRDGTVVVGYNYKLVHNGLEDRTVGSAWEVSVEETEVTVPGMKYCFQLLTCSVTDVLSSWCPDTELIAVADVFNDKLDYHCCCLADVARLNKDILRVAEKFKFFDNTVAARKALQEFRDNYEKLQSFIFQIDEMLRDARSRLVEHQQRVTLLNKTLRTQVAEIGTSVEDTEALLMLGRMSKLRKSKINELPMFRGSLGDPYHNEITSWLPNKKFSLLYRGSVAGFKARNFHSTCDNMGSTITLIQTTDDYLFGGYTSHTWSSCAGFVDVNETFLFTLVNPFNIPPTKFSPKLTEHSIYDHGSVGPTFGHGFDIHVSSNCDKNNLSYVGFPHSFLDTTGKGQHLFHGKRNFTVQELEVFIVLD